MLRKIAFIITQIIFVFVLAAAVSASEVPTFPSCSNPQGTLKVSYDSGTHYIVGGGGVFGSDAVYYTGDNTLIQCFCAEDGSGIQTNWWRIDCMDSETIDTYVKLGWYYIPSGANWGLDASPYLAQNANYTCKYIPTTTPTPTQHNNSGGGETPVCTAPRPNAPIILSVVESGTSATITWTKVDLATHYTIAYGPIGGGYPYGVPNTGNVTSYTIHELDPNTDYQYLVYAVNDCMPSEAGGRGGSVLGLATTGDSALLYSVFAASLLATGVGVALRRKAN